MHAAQSTNDSSNALSTLATMINAWCGGRPMPGPMRGLSFFKELAKYGREYRSVVQDSLWRALRAGDLRSASIIHALGRVLLPRRVDRCYACLPPPLTWRIERYLLGMHK